MKKLVYSLFFVLGCIIQLNAQVKTEKRIEFELKEGYAGYSLTEFKDKGIMVYYHEEKSKGGIMTWKVDHYSTDLELIESKEFKMDDNYYLSKAKDAGSNMYLFFVSRKSEYQLMQIDVESLKTKTVKGLVPKKAASSSMEIIDENIFIAFSTKKAKTLKRIDVGSGKDKDIPLEVAGFKPNVVSFENFQVDEDSKELYIFLNVMIGKDLDVYVQRFDADGKRQESFNLSEGTDKKLTSVSGSYLAEGEYMFTGTYSSNKRVTGSTSEGIYICKTTGGKKDFLKFYNFTDFEEFMSYLPQKKQDKIEKKKDKAEAKGKEFSISYLMSSHNIRFMDGKFIYIGEAFYPTYRTEYYTTYVNGKPVTSTRQVFDGYQYTHATVAAFDIEGEKLWDVTFEMNPWYKPYSVIRFIRVTETSDTELGLMFSSFNTLKSKAVTSEGEIISEREVSMIETGDEDDKVKSTWSNLTFWYDNYFLAHGTQTIKNKEEKEERGKAKRSVYFINKISYSF